MLAFDDSNHERWFVKHPNLTVGIFIVIMIAILLSLAEILLRLFGETTGPIMPTAKPIHNIEELRLLNPKPFYTDGEGVFKANPVYDWDAGRYGIGVHVNSEGFRGAEFRSVDTSAESILFVGDSFTWGASANPISCCFVDLVAKSGYVIYNMGIPGTDTVQYAFLAEKYIPVLKPDVICVMVYMGNDINDRPTPMIPYKDIWYITDAMWLYAFDDNKNPLSLEEAFQKYYVMDYSPAVLKNRAKNLLMHSAVGKRFWLFMRHMKSRRSYSVLNENSESSILERLTKIQRLAQNFKTRFLLFLIPSHPDLDNALVSEREACQILGNLNPRVVTSLSRKDYMRMPDDHLNNSGHAKVAAFILEVLRTEGSSQSSGKVPIDQRVDSPRFPMK